MFEESSPRIEWHVASIRRNVVTASQSKSVDVPRLPLRVATMHSARLRESVWKSPPQCRHLDEETEPATGRKKTSPSRQAEGQITSGGADGKKTGRRKKRWRSIRKKTPPKNTAKPWFSNRQIYVGFGTVLTEGFHMRRPAQSQATEPSLHLCYQVIHRCGDFHRAAPVHGSRERTRG